MRTRNRGKRTSFVSSLGLAPRRTAERKFTQLVEGKTKPATRSKLNSHSETTSCLLTTRLGRVELRHRGRAYGHRILRNPLGKIEKVNVPLAKRTSRRGNYLTSTTGTALIKNVFSKKYSPPPTTDRTSSSKLTPENSRERRQKRQYSNTKPIVSVAAEETTRFQGSSRKRKILNASNISHTTDHTPSLNQKYSTPERPLVHRAMHQPSLSASKALLVSARKRNGKMLATRSNPPYDVMTTPLSTDLITIASTATEVKRRRGRPPYDSSSNCIPSDKKQGSLSTTSLTSSLPLLDTQSEIRKCRTPDGQPGVPSLSRLPCMPSQLSPSFLFNDSGQVRFGASDDVLHDILREVNANGYVPHVIWPTPPVKAKLAEKQLDFVDDSNKDFVFDVPVIKTVFDDIWEKCDKFMGLQTKDLFLAINGLLRPGVCELWRRKREDQTKKLSRSVMGRLRPNPRPRRYSDMITSNTGGLSVNSSARQTLETTTLVEKVRQGSRSIVLANARLTAAKRLMRARSQPSTTPAFVAPEMKRSRTDRISDGVLLQGPLPGRLRAVRQSGKILSPVCPSTRAKRRPDVSQHIHWKFCYPSVGKEDAIEAPLSTGTSYRKRKVKSPAASQPDEVEIPDDSVDKSSSQDHQNITPEPDTSAPVEEPPVKDESEPIATAPEEVKSDKLPSPTPNDQPSIMLLEKPIAARRKRRHALTVQRKRPIDRFLTGHDRQCWRMERNIPTHLEDLSSNSSSTSTSGLADAYGRIFRPSKWYHKRGSKITQTKRIPVRRISNVLPINQHKYSRPLNTIKNRQPMVSANMPRRSTVVKHEPRSMSPKHRISRRPDRMCQLTLLDRLVLGLNCSVSQNDKEIHIKQLHADELGILTQRMDKTGFFIQSLSVRQNSNNDSEYNLVLTFSPTAEPAIRRPRISTSSTHHRGVNSDNASEVSMKYQNNRISLKRFSTRVPMTKLERSLRSTSSSNLKSKSSGSGYLSDSAVTLKRHHFALGSLRQVHSDNEDALPYPSVVPNDRKLSAFILGSGYFQAASSSKSQGRHEQWPQDGYSTHVSSTWAHQESHRRPGTAHSDHRSSTPDINVSQKRTISTKSDSITDSVEPDTHASVTPSSSSPHQVVPHVVSKRGSKAGSSAVQSTSTFRRPSPRKVIRKVYTGSSTIPKILNRRRPPGAPPVPLSVSSSSMTTSTTGILPSSLTQGASTVTSSASSSTHGSTNISPCVNKPMSSNALFEESNPPMTVYTQSTPNLPTQYRRLQASVTPVSIMSTTFHSPEQLPMNLVHESTLSPMQPGLAVASHTARFITTPSPSSGLVPIPSQVQSESKSSAIIESNEPTPADNVFECVPPPSELAPASTNMDNIGSPSTLPPLPFTVEPQSEQPSPVKSPESSKAETVIHVQINTSEPSEQTPMTPMTQSQGETQVDGDDSRTPATALSASQLLKLKRLHDESGRPLSSQSEGRPAQFLSQPPGRVQSPQSLASRSQAQPINTDSTILQSRQSTQFMPNQDFSSSSPYSIAGSIKFGPGFCPVSTVIEQSTTRNTPPHGDDEDMDDFELGTVGGKVYGELPPVSTHSTFIQRLPCTSSDGKFVPTTIYRPTFDVPHYASTPSLLNPIRAYRPTWSHVRSFLPNTAHMSPLVSPLASTNFSVVRGYPTLMRPTFDSHTPNQVSTRVVVQEPQLMNRIGEVSPVICETSRPSSPMNSALTTIPTATGFPHAFSLPGFANSTGLPIIAGPNKRTVVHKYHSFRKILPKSPEPSGLICAPTAPNPAFMNLTPVSFPTPCLTQLPVVSNVYRNTLSPQPTAIPYDGSNQATYFLDASSIGRTNSGESGTSSIGVPPNPASQLLKSLLESSAGKEQGSTQPVAAVTTSATPSSTTQPISNVSTTWNQPAHQSRGTWQLGKRATCNLPQRGPSDATLVPGTRAPATSSISRSHSATAIPSSNNRSPSLTVPTQTGIRTSGTTSRLQQMQQFHQRRQQLLAQRQAQKQREHEAAVRGE